MQCTCFVLWDRTSRGLFISECSVLVLCYGTEHAIRAQAELDGTIFQGRLLHIIASKVRPVAKDELDLSQMTEGQKNALTHKKRKVRALLL